jgi:hypothetical protein
MQAMKIGLSIGASGTDYKSAPAGGGADYAGQKGLLEIEVIE